jgi:hypothetical protein
MTGFLKYIFFLLALSFFKEAVLAQTIDLDEEEGMDFPILSERSTYYYFTPMGTFGLQLGHQAMQRRLDNSFGLKMNRLTDYSGVGIGWRRNLMFYNFNFYFPAIASVNFDRSSSGSTIIESRDFFGDFSIGRAIVANDHHFIILRAGLGVVGRELSITQYDGSSFDFNNFRAGNGQAWPRLEHISGTLDIGLEYLPRALRAVSAMESIQLGYKTGIGSPRWRSSDATLVNSFGDRVSLIYLKAAVVISRER